MTATSKKVLKLHRTKKQYRGHSGTEDLDFIVAFLFSINDESAQVLSLIRISEPTRPRLISNAVF